MDHILTVDEVKKGDGGFFASELNYTCGIQFSY